MDKYLSMKEAANRVTELLRSHTPLSFFSGAGISMHEPSFLPDWSNFRNALLSTLINRLHKNDIITNEQCTVIKNELLKFDNIYGSIEHGLWLKPEIVLYWLSSYIPTAVHKALTVFDLGHPNINHYTLAHIAANSDTLLATCNFDTLIENAIKTNEDNYIAFAGNKKSGKCLSFSDYYRPNEYLDGKIIRLLKIHGCISAPKTIKATITQVSRPVSKASKESLKYLLNNRVLVVVGYSGRDPDIRKEIEANANKSKQIIWLAFNKDSLIPEVKNLQNTIIGLGDINVFFDEISKLLNCNFILKANNVISIYNKIENAVKYSKIFPTAMALSELASHIGCHKSVEILSKAVIEKSQNAKWVGLAWMALGDSKRRSNPSDALQYFKEAKKLIEVSKSDYPLLYGHVLKYLAQQNYVLGYLRDALTINTKSLIWIRKTNDKATEGRALDDRAIFYRQLGNIKYAIRLRKKAIQILEKEGDLVSLAMVYNNLGKDYDKLDKFPEAEYWWRKSINLKEKETSNSPDLGRSCYNLGELLRHTGKNEDAIVYLSRARYRANIHNDNVIQTRILFSLAAIAYSRDKIKQAKRLLESAESQASKTIDWNSNSGRLEWADDIRRMIIEGIDSD